MSETSLVGRRSYELSLVQPSLFQDIRERCWDEVHRRLAEEPGAIRGTDLFRLFLEMSKLELQMAKGAQQAGEVKSRGILEAIAGLPPERQQAMLEQAIAMLDELGEDASVHREVLEKLTKGAENGQPVRRGAVPAQGGDDG